MDKDAIVPCVQIAGRCSPPKLRLQAICTTKKGPSVRADHPTNTANPRTETRPLPID